MEGHSNKIKTLKRVAFGFRNFTHFKARILLMSIKEKNRKILFHKLPIVTIDLFGVPKINDFKLFLPNIFDQLKKLR